MIKKNNSPPKTYGLTHKRITVTFDAVESEIEKKVVINEEGLEFLKSAEAQKFFNQPKETHILDELETLARNRLREMGLSDDWEDHIRKSPAEFPHEQGFHATQVLSHISKVRHWIKENNASAAVLATIHMMEASNNSRLTEFEPDIYRGKKAVENAAAGGQMIQFKNQLNRRKWQKEADKIWRENPKLSTRKVAEHIAKLTSISAETIRPHLKKPYIIK